MFQQFSDKRYQSEVSSGLQTKRKICMAHKQVISPTEEPGDEQHLNMCEELWSTVHEKPLTRVFSLDALINSLASWESMCSVITVGYWSALGKSGACSALGGDTETSDMREGRVNIMCVRESYTEENEKCPAILFREGHARTCGGV